MIICHCRSSYGKPKKRFATRKEAKKEAKAMSQKEGIRYRVYECPSGYCWHYTSQPLRRRNRPEKET